MTDEELIKALRGWMTSTSFDDDAHAAADRIEQLVKERDDAEQREITKIEVNHQRVVSYLTRVKAAEAKLAKAVEALRQIRAGAKFGPAWCIADGVLDKLEKAE